MLSGVRKKATVVTCTWAAPGRTERKHETVAKQKQPPQPTQPRYHGCGAHTCNTRSKRKYNNIVLIYSRNKMYIHANFHVRVSFGFHSYNALFVLIAISNTRSKRVNENITTLCTFPEENIYVYMQIFRFVSVSVIDIREFNKKMKKKNMTKL